MADGIPKQPPRRRGRRALRILRTIGLFLLGLLLLLALFAGGLLLFARTDTGQRWITGKVNAVLTSALAPSGLSARIDSLTGSLPSRLGFAGLTVSDADGPWLTVDQAQVNMGWSALRKRSLVLRSIRIDHPVLTRLPHLAERPRTDSGQPFDPLALLAKLADWPDWLPSVAVENVDINGLTLGPEVAGEAMILSLHGSASASSQNVQAALSLRRDDKPGAEQAEIRAALRPDAYLILSVALAETSDGLLVRAVPPALAKAPALRFLLQGSAPLADWKGDVHVDLLETDTTEMSGATVNDRVALALKGGLEAAPLERNPRLNWNLTASTGKASTGLWRMAGQKNGQAVARLTGRAVLERPDPAPQSPAGQEGVMAARAQGHVSLNLSDMEWSDVRLSALAGSDAKLETDYALVWRKASSDTPGRASAPGPDLPGPNALSLDATLRGLRLTARELSARGDASWHLAGMDPLAPGSALDMELAADLADASSLALPDVAAQGTLSIRLRAHGPMSGLEADLSLDGEALAVRGEVLEKPQIHLSAADLDVSALIAGLAGKDGADATGTETTGRGVVEASVRARGQAVELNSHWEVTPGRDALAAAVHNLSLRAAGLRVDGDLNAVLPTSARPDAVADGSAAPAPPVLSGSLRADVTDWKVLSGLSGVPLRGGKASLAVNLSPGADGQEADAALSVDHLRVGGRDGSETASVSQLRGTLKVEDAFRHPCLDAAFRDRKSVV